MKLNARKQKILEMLEKNGNVSVAELSKYFDISEVTIRTYLTDLEAKGLLSRVHGGAISSYKPYYSMNLSQRLNTNQKQKRKIAEEVAKMVEDKDTIMLNSGTTTLLVFRSLPTNYNLNIVTNSIAIALEAADIPNFNVCLVGGSVNSKYQFSYGDDAIEQLKKYHANKLILSVDGIDLKSGFTTYYDKEAAIDRTMIEQSENCIIAADTTKFERTAFAKIAPLTVADLIVTNETLNDGIYESLTSLGVDIQKA